MKSIRKIIAIALIFCLIIINVGCIPTPAPDIYGRLETPGENYELKGITSIEGWVFKDKGIKEINIFCF